jgi:hypothetical protein
VALLEIAAAWDQCAKEAAEKGMKKIDDAPGFGDDPQAPNA